VLSASRSAPPVTRMSMTASPQPPGIREDVLYAQRMNNRESAGLWDGYAEHRQRTTDLVVGIRNGTKGGSLVVLGAGNCNDLDLPRLLTEFSHIHLVESTKVRCAPACNGRACSLRSS
jgi:hypothetical protein